MHIEDVLKDLTAKGLSSHQIALACGVSQPTVWRYLNGRTKNGRVDIVEKFTTLHDQIFRKEKPDLLPAYLTAKKKKI